MKRKLIILSVGNRNLNGKSFEAFVFKGTFLKRLLSVSRTLDIPVSYDELIRIIRRLIGIEIKNPRVEELIRVISQESRVVHILRNKCYFAFRGFFQENLCVKRNGLGEFYWGFNTDENYNLDSIMEVKSQKNKNRNNLILLQRYCCFGKSQTYAVLSKKHRLTRSRIGQIVKTSLQKIRRNENIKNFTFYMIDQFENKTICDIKSLNDVVGKSYIAMGIIKIC